MKNILAAASFLPALLLAGLISHSRPEPLPIFPGPIEDPQFIYHPPTKSMLMVGGNPVLQDSVESPVWKWNGQWSKIDAKGPGARVFFQGALNSKTNTIESFAGAGLARVNPLLDDLWSFDGKKWQRIKNNDIGPRDHHKMVYADHLNAYILYGGGINHVFDTTTWLMRDGKFTALHIPSPGVRYQFGMVYDKHRKKVVLYGGGEKPGEQWEFDGKRWEKIVTAINPGTRSYHFMAYDENLQAVVLHGGSVNNHPQDPVNLATPVTWLWDGIAWKKITEANIFPLTIGYNPLRKSIMAYGYNDGNARNPRHLQLWELRDHKWTQLDDYGEWNTIDYLEQQLKQNPNNTMALFSYAQELKSAKRLPEAEIAFRKLEPANLPNKSSVWFGLIEVLRDEGKLDEAREYLFKAERLQLIPESRRMAVLYYNLACAFALKSDADKAFESLHKAAGFGYDNKKDYESDTDLTTLKKDERWKELLKRLK